MVGDSIAHLLAKAREMCEERKFCESKEEILAALDEIDLNRILREVEVDGYVQGYRLA